MIPAEFAYRRASTVDEALALLAAHGEDAKVLAGGHSLLPLMKLRFAAPEVVVDIAPLRELRFVRTDGDEVVIGALSRYHDLEHDPVLAEHAPLLAHVSGSVGDPQVRHRGTIGGSLVHADSTADLPAAVLAADGTLVARGPGESGGSRPRNSSSGRSRRRWNRTSCSPRSGCPARPDSAGASRSSPAGPSTGRSWASRSPGVRSA